MYPVDRMGKDTLDAESLLPTRRSLISRLRNCEDQESWRDFFNTYWKLIYGFAIRCGCTDSEAEEVVQETVISLARKMPEYRYDPAVCTFKGWLLHVTNWRVIDQIRKRKRASRAENLDPADLEDLDRISEPALPDLEALWDEEWQKNLVDAAMERVKKKVNAEHFQIFHLQLVKGYAPAKVASLMKVSLPRVYLAKHRVAALVQKEIRLLTRKLL